MNQFTIQMSNAVVKRLFPRVAAVRNLYSATYLGIDGYVHSRLKIKSQYADNEEKFKNKMKQLTESESLRTIFTEDLKHMIHLVEGKKEEMNLVREMMTKFCEQNRELRFGSFIFGPVIMRMYYYLNRPIEAYNSFVDLHENGFFDQLITYQILMDLLFRNEMYVEMLEVFKIVKSRQIQGAIYPKNVVVLAFAACYKMNSEESLEVAKKLWSDLNKGGHNPRRRAGTFVAALAIAQNAPHIALEIIATIKTQTYVTVRNLKVAALADIGRPDDALPILLNVLAFNDRNTGAKHTFNEMVIRKLRTSVEKFNNAEVTREFNGIVGDLKAQGLIDSKPLDDHLCSDIVAPSFISENQLSKMRIGGKQRLRRSQGLIDML